MHEAVTVHARLCESAQGGSLHLCSLDLRNGNKFLSRDRARAAPAPRACHTKSARYTQFILCINTTEIRAENSENMKDRQEDLIINLLVSPKG